MSKTVGEELTKKQKSSRIQQLFHDSMHIVLEPLKQPGKKGMEVVFGDGRVRMVHPILACYVADYPEQCLATCAKYGTCPKCNLKEDEIGGRRSGRWRTQRETMKVISEALSTSTSMSGFQQLCKSHLISGAVTRPFWQGFPLCDIHLAIVPDILHQLYQGVVKHLTNWCASLMSEKELDSRIRTLPPCFGVRHFQKGWSELAQVSGKERKDMARILLGCIVGKVPSRVIACYRALLDFIYIAQYTTHDDSSLEYLEEALEEFQAHKDVLMELDVREHLNIPKFHSMVHYMQAIKEYGTTDNYNTEMFERFHIDCAKEAWRASNSRNEVPQMTQWLSRQEKVAMFQSYLEATEMEMEGGGEMTEEEENEKDEEQETLGNASNWMAGASIAQPAPPAPPGTSLPTLTGPTEASQPLPTSTSTPVSLDKYVPAIIISKRPHASRQTLNNIIARHNCPSFVHQLRSYLNSFMGSGNTIPRSQLPYANLPFNKLDVWHAFKFPLDVLGNDVDPKLEIDMLRAKPGRRPQQGRFDTVIVANSSDAHSTGMAGELPTDNLNNICSFISF